jgi:hypothetical protein
MKVLDLTTKVAKSECISKIRVLQIAVQFQFFYVQETSVSDVTLRHQAERL